MRPGAKIVILLFSLSGGAAAQTCFLDCMQRSGCWSGRSVSDPGSCNNMPQLCTIQCQGKKGDTWGAIAYSKKEKISGWSNAQRDGGTADRTAMQYCTKAGGNSCVVEATFHNECGAVAVDGDHVTWGVSKTKAGAVERAMSECSKDGGKKCAIEQSVCSDPDGGADSSSSSSTLPPPPKAISWGAIAYSSKDMGAGYSQGKSDQASAEKEAMSLCAQRGKACVLETAFNKQCGALAADGSFTGTGTSTDQRAALQQAMDACKKAGGARCTPHIAFCSM
jgi:Domain of unknown function (DUF4189)